LLADSFQKEAQAALEGSLTGSGPLIMLDEILLAPFLVLSYSEQLLLDCIFNCKMRDEQGGGVIFSPPSLDS
jgi:hypothetical protein